MRVTIALSTASTSTVVQTQYHHHERIRFLTYE
ncbi:unnamed protein product, partial [Onchocerca ochengi]|uniref:Quaking_NLS domain-containing protein n=1 Tax=Onchocerca ochengi TaxID=42157 RepID=A0A182ETJ9_ONCOC